MVVNNYIKLTEISERSFYKKSFIYTSNKVIANDMSVTLCTCWLVSIIRNYAYIYTISYIHHTYIYMYIFLFALLLSIVKPIIEQLRHFHAQHWRNTLTNSPKPVKQIVKYTYVDTCALVVTLRAFNQSEYLTIKRKHAHREKIFYWIRRL